MTYPLKLKRLLNGLHIYIFLNFLKRGMNEFMNPIMHSFRSQPAKKYHPRNIHTFQPLPVIIRPIINLSSSPGWGGCEDPRSGVRCPGIWSEWRHWSRWKKQINSNSKIEGALAQPVKHYSKLRSASVIIVSEPALFCIPSGGIIKLQSDREYHSG